MGWPLLLIEHLDFWPQAWLSCCYTTRILELDWTFPGHLYSPNWYACLSLGPYVACWVPTSAKQDPLPVHWFLPLHQCSLSIQWQVLLQAKIQHCGILLRLILAAHCQDKFPYKVKSIQHTLLNSFLQEVFTEHLKTGTIVEQQLGNVVLYNEMHRIAWRAYTL